MQRRQWPAEENIIVVLEGLRGDESIPKICAKHGISQSQYYKWRDTFLEVSKSTFENENPKKEKMLENINK